MRELFRKEIEMANRGISFARVCNRARCHDAWRTWVHVDSSQSNNKKTEEETQKKKKKKQKKNIILDSIDVSRSWKLLFICSVVVGFFFSLFFTLLVLSSSSVAFPFSYMLFFFYSCCFLFFCRLWTNDCCVQSTERGHNNWIEFIRTQRVCVCPFGDWVHSAFLVCAVCVICVYKYLHLLCLIFDRHRQWPTNFRSVQWCRCILY